MTVGLTPIRRSDGKSLAQGTQFAVALGNFRTASLLIANVSGSEIGVDVNIGTAAATNFGIFTNPKIPTNGIWRVTLTPNERSSNLVVTSTGLMIIEAIIDDGKSINAFQVLPTQ